MPKTWGMLDLDQAQLWFVRVLVSKIGFGESMKGDGA